MKKNTETLQGTLLTKLIQKGVSKFGLTQEEAERQANSLVDSLGFDKSIADQKHSLNELLNGLHRISERKGLEL